MTTDIQSKRKVMLRMLLFNVGEVREVCVSLPVFGGF